jgi:hypothetical protein
MEGYMKTAEEYKEELEELAEQMNCLSDYLVGFREGSFAEMKERIIELRAIERTTMIREDKIDTLKAIDDLKFIIADI